MAFKSMNQYNKERYGGFFRLINDGDAADVIFLYRNMDDVLVADTHYIKSTDYQGYVHCCGRGCPACNKGLRVQAKLFIPVYNLTANEIQFWDRNVRFESKLSSDIFSKFPNPSEYVFRITRRGAANDIETTYDIQVVGRNSQESYDQILKRFGVTMPDHYRIVCEDFDAQKVSTLLTDSGSSSYSDNLPDYSVKPRTTASVVPPVYEPVPEDTMLPPDDISDDSSEGSDEGLEDAIF